MSSNARSVAWKELERCAARFFGTVRTALSGGNSKITRSDTLHDRLYVECKYGQRVAPWTLYMDALTKAKLEDKIPVLVLKQARESDFLLVMRSQDLGTVYSEREAAVFDKETQKEIRDET